MMATIPLIDVCGVSKKFAHFELEPTTFQLQANEFLAIIGESGSGKTTLAQMLVQLLPPSAGHIAYNGQPYSVKTVNERRQFAQLCQIIFQNPKQYLPQKKKIAWIIHHIMGIYKLSDMEAHLSFLLEELELDEALLSAYAHQLSGGQAQRVALLLALLLKPQCIVADEITSAVDLKMQRKVLDLCVRLKSEMGGIFVLHDLKQVAFFCDKVLVLKEGKVVEMGSVEEVFTRPKTVYTKLLLKAQL